jgi:lipopolysaccharide transport system ATP-binding protein
MSDIAIKVENLSKCYPIFDTPRDRLKQMILPRVAGLVGANPKKYYREFWALRDVSFEVKRGETVGVIGRNGAGKSTLLQLICGTLSPTGGSLKVDGRVAALLELGSGFNPEFTGRENVILKATILGLTSKEIENRYEDIIAFADIDNFIDQPLKTYSSGMAMRLAFSVVAHVDADVVIIDEALSVGDARFQQKCLRVIDELRKKAAVLFVTHDISAIKNFCQKAIWINNGIIKASGVASDVANEYLDDCFGISKVDNTIKRINTPILNLPVIPISCIEKGTKELEITQAGFLNEKGELTSTPKIGEFTEYRIRIHSNKILDVPIVVGITMTNKLGQEIFSINSLWSKEKVNLLPPSIGDSNVYKIRFTIPELTSGTYFISPAVAIGSQDNHEIIHWIYDATIIEIPFSPRNRLPGIMILQNYFIEQLS